MTRLALIASALTFPLAGGCVTARQVAITGTQVRAIEVAHRVFSDGFEDPDPKSCAREINSFDYRVDEQPDRFLVRVRWSDRCFVRDSYGPDEAAIEIRKSDYSVIGVTVSN